MYALTLTLTNTVEWFIALQIYEWAVPFQWHRILMQAYYRKHQGKSVKSDIVKVGRKRLSRTLALIKTETPYEIGVVE